MKTFVERLNKALGLAEATTIMHGGARYGVGNVEIDGSRSILSPGGQRAGKIDQAGNLEVWGTGSPERVQRIMKTMGWDVSWERPGLRGKERQSKFFQAKTDDKECTQCGGTGEQPGSSANVDVVGGKAIKKRGKPCTMCYGVGQINQRVNQFVDSLRARGLGPKVRLNRKVVKSIPQYGTPASKITEPEEA